MLNQPFFQVALPMMVTFVATVWAAAWSQNKRLEEMSKRFDDLNRRFDDVNRRLDRIEAKLETFGERIGALETARWR